MKKLTFYMSILIITLYFGCKSESKSKQNSISNLDSKKTIELIIQILDDEKIGYLSASCILEKPMFSHSDKSFEELAEKQLNIKDSIHYKIQKERFKAFKIEKKIVRNKNILTEIQFNEFEEKSKQSGFIFWEWLDENCNNGYCFVSKPIFNETFDLAFVEVGTICGRLCGGGEDRIYEFKNGNWILKETIGSWVS